MKVSIIWKDRKLGLKSTIKVSSPVYILLLSKVSETLFLNNDDVSTRATILFERKAADEAAGEGNIVEGEQERGSG